MNTKKKILFLVTQSEFGGAQRFIYRLITNLDLAKYDISIAAGPEGNDADGLLFNLKKEGFNNFSLKFLKRSINPIIDFLGIVEIYKLIKKQNPDIVFLCSTKAGILGSIAARISGKRVIYRIGGWTFNDPWPEWKKRLYVGLEKNTARFKDFIVNNAESDRQQAIKLGIRPKREILTIYNGVDVENLNFLSKQEAIKELITKSKIQILNQIEGSNLKLIGTVANLYPCKGLEYLIEAAKLLDDPQKKFIIIGEGAGRAELEGLIKKNNLNNVFLIGAMSDAWKYLKAFDIFVLPSVKEGFPWTLIEAMAAKIPVVATKVGAIPEILISPKNSEESGILIDSREPYQIVEAINLLLKEKELINLLVSRAGKTVKEKFTLEQMVNSFENLFNNL
jgi:glycosyltransferase involved in cell wall biosynthesis